MYSNTMYSCKSNNTMSEPFVANRGVKQGDNLSPTLFNIYVDDFLEYLNSSVTSLAYLDSTPVNHLFFADDLVLISESPSGLQHCLNALEKILYRLAIASEHGQNQSHDFL